ncbi:helix-turn-helix domain-containing protein [Photobacterium indicum]|uniref:helix-turn-helix domain-containing protein n=1 Tax=Photobacterium indicum TaxID=81447 RepID=UPI003D0C5DF2
MSNVNKPLKDHLMALLQTTEGTGEDCFVSGISKLHEMLSDEEAKAIGERIKSNRKDHPFGALSQAQLAKKAKVDKSVISRIESGDKKTISFNVYKVGKALGVRVQTLVLNEQLNLALDYEVQLLIGNSSGIAHYASMLSEQLSNQTECPDIEKKLSEINKKLSLIINDLSGLNIATQHKW